MQLKEKVAEQRAARLQTERPGRDFTRYDLKVAGELHPAQAKRNMIFHVVAAALAHGASRAQLPIPEGKWLVLNEPALDAQMFAIHAQQQTGSFDPGRWFSAPNQLFRAEGQTFALSNQWSGPIMLPILDEIRRLFPQLAISYQPSAGDD